MSWLDTLESIRKKDFKKVGAKEREKTARDVVNMCSYATAVVSVSPIPFSDAILMLPIQTGMVVTIGHIFGRRVDQAAAKDLLLEMGATAGIGFLARQGIKAMLPFFGALLTVPAAFAANWAMGRVAMEYFKQPNVSKDFLREVYEEAKREGDSLFSMDHFTNFKEENEESITEVSEETPKKKKPKKKAKLLTPKRIIEEQIPARLAKKKALIKEIGAVIHVDLSGSNGGQWTLDLTRKDDWVSQGLSGEPKLTVRASADDFLEIATGKRDPQMAVLTGALTFDPMDLELAGAIGKLFT